MTRRRRPERVVLAPALVRDMPTVERHCRWCGHVIVDRLGWGDYAHPHSGSIYCGPHPGPRAEPHPYP